MSMKSSWCMHKFLFLHLGWGPQLEQATHKKHHRLYLSEQIDGTVPNTLIIANCEVVKPRVAAAEEIAKFKEGARSSFVKKWKTIMHPGEVNRIRELPENSNIVATHTNSLGVLIWDVETQPNRQPVLGATSISSRSGKDKSVVLWSIHDHISSLVADQGVVKSPGSKGGSVNIKPSDIPTVQARGTFQGHVETVEDVQFCP